MAFVICRACFKSFRKCDGVGDGLCSEPCKKTQPNPKCADGDHAAPKIVSVEFRNGSTHLKRVCSKCGMGHGKGQFVPKNYAVH